MTARPADLIMRGPDADRMFGPPVPANARAHSASSDSSSMPPPAPNTAADERSTDREPSRWAEHDRATLPPWRDVVVPPAPTPVTAAVVSEPTRASGLRSSVAAVVITALVAGGLGFAMARSAQSDRLEAAQGESAQALTQARSDGYDAGYDSGVSAGSSDDSDQYDKGHDAGYDKGYAKGTTDGYQDGYSDGAQARTSTTPTAAPSTSTSEWASGSVNLEELSYGTTDSDSVSHLQWALQQLGYDTVIDGDYLSQTDTAVRAWQTSIGNEPDPVGESSLGAVQAERLFAPYSGITVG